jgi:hypothetical protein
MHEAKYIERFKERESSQSFAYLVVAWHSGVSSSWRQRIVRDVEDSLEFLLCCAKD